jgi:hypothetical protein
MSVGEKFNYQNVNNLVLGEKPDSSYEIMFGKPRSVVSRKDPGGEFRQVYYVYGSMYEGVRMLTLEYKDEALNAYFYLTNCDQEYAYVYSKYFDEVKIGHTKEEVEQLLGKPNGQALCPCYLGMFEEHCRFGNEIWSWNLFKSPSDYDDSSPEAVSMYVIFDRKGAVINTLQEQRSLD